VAARARPTRYLDCVKTQTPLGLQPVVSQFQPRGKQQRFLDTTDFSRVEFQFPPNFAASKKAKTETPRD